MEIAKAAGISQAYLFRLFPTKAELFIALVERCNDAHPRDVRRRRRRGAKAAGEDVLPAMGMAYVGLLADRNLLLNQLHAHAACDDPAIREQMRARLRAARRARRARDGRRRPTRCALFFAHGMLLNVLAAMQRRRTSTRTGRRCCSARRPIDCC